MDSRRIAPVIQCGPSFAARFASTVALCGAAAFAWAAPLSADEINVLRELDTRYSYATPSPSAVRLAGRIGREGNVDGLRAIIQLRNVALLHNAVQSHDAGASRQLPEALEALIVEHYADAPLKQPLLGLLARRIDRLERFPQFGSRRLFDLLYADLKNNSADQLRFAICIVATDVSGIEPELVALLPDLGQAAANELVMYLGVRRYAAAVPALIALQARTPFARDMNGLLQHINGALLQIGTPQAMQAVFDRMRALGGQSADPRAGSEIWTILLNMAALPAASAPDYAEIRAALPAELTQSAWSTLIKLIVARKEKRGIPDLIRAVTQVPAFEEAIDALLVMAEPSDWQAARAALQSRDGGRSPDRLAELQRRLDEAIADPPKWLARRRQNEREQALQETERQFNEEKSRLAVFRSKEPRRYADGLRALIERREALLRDYADLPYSTGATQQLVREYTVLAAFLRFQLRQPDEAIAAYQAAMRLQPAAARLDLISLTIADIERFDKRNPLKAIEQYRLALASLSRASNVPGPPDSMPFLGLRRWIEHETDYLQSKKSFSGAVVREDLAAVQMWILLFGSMQQEMDPAVHEAINRTRAAAMRGEKLSPAASGLQHALDGLSSSQLQIPSAFMAAFQLPPADMLRFFAKHDPAGYVTAGLLALVTYRAPGASARGLFDLDADLYGSQDAVKSAADRFFRSRRIRIALAPEPRFASPEKTWALFIDSAKKGDTAAMLACFATGMRAKLQGLFTTMSRDDLRKMGESFVKFSIEKGSPPDYREAIVLRQSGERKMAGFVYFVNDGGDWKIESM